MISQLRIFATLVFTIVTLMGSQIALSAEHKALPVDEAVSDASLLAFRNGLLQAIGRRDVEYVVKSATSDIHLSFGGHAGRNDFRNFLDISNRDYLTAELQRQAETNVEKYWNALEQVLRLGGQFKTPDVFEAPYTWTFKLSDGSDPFSTYFVIKKDALLRDQPSKTGTIVHNLSYDIVTKVAGKQEAGFMQVKLASGQQGFVLVDNLRSRVDYRAIMGRVDGKWYITTFIAGD